MNLSIKNNFGTFSEKKIILADGEGINLTVFLSESFSKIGEFFLACNFNGRTTTIPLGKARNNIAVTIPSSFVSEAGVLDFDLIQRSENQDVVINEGAYTIEPIVIERLQNGSFLGTAQYQELISQLNDMTKAFEEEKNERKSAEKAFEELKKDFEEREKKRDDEIKKIRAMMEIVVEDRYHISLAELEKENGI